MIPVQMFAVTAEGPVPLALPVEVYDIHDAFDQLPVGVYTAFRTFQHNKLLGLVEHLDRLQESMDSMDWAYLLDQEQVRSALHQVCSQYPGKNARVRIDVLAEPALPLGSNSRVLIALAHFRGIPPELYQQGVHVGLTGGLSRPQPRVKHASFVAERRQFLSSHPPVYEYLMLDEAGCILEGTGSNFYGILEGRIRTAGEHVLHGIARKIVLQVAERLAIPVDFLPVRREEVCELDEAALSSSSRGIIPIVRIDNETISSGRPGPITRKLIAAYNLFVEEHISTAIEENL